MLDRLTRLQLSIFAVVTVICVGAISVFYLHVPAAVGLGSYNVTANFVAGGGLYENANVTYRGVTIGRVESVGLSNDGVVAHMRLNSDTPVPDNVTATVKSVSAVGEQYVDLVPPADASNQMLRDKSDIGMDHTAIGQDISGLLTQADALVNSIGNSRIQDLLRETFKAFNGSGPELSRLIQSSRLLVDEANANYGQTTQLIDQVGPFLDAQIRSGDDIKSLADGLARFTSEAAKADPQLRNVLQTVPGATEAANTTFDGIRPTFPMLAANLANFGRIGVIYRKSIEQALVIFPALMAALITVGGGVPADEGGKLDFKVDLGDPPPCSTGFIPPTEIRSPADTTLRDLPTDLYCKTAQNDADRGAWRAQLPVPGVPRKAGPDRPAVPRPARLRADRHQPVARAAHPVRDTDGPTRGQSLRAARAKHSALQQVSVHPAGSRLRPRPTVRAVAARACCPARAPRPMRPSRCPCRRATRGCLRRRGRTTPRPIRSCRRTAGLRPKRPLRPPQGRCPPRRPRPMRRLPTRPLPMPRHRPSTVRRRRPAVRRPPRTIQGPVCSPTPPGGRACSPEVRTRLRPRRRGST